MAGFSQPIELPITGDPNFVATAGEIVELNDFGKIQSCRRQFLFFGGGIILRGGIVCHRRNHRQVLVLR